MDLYEELLQYSETGKYPMHMPGHKRSMRFAGLLPYKLDITEIPGFDNLHDMNGILAELSRRAAVLYDAEAAFPLVGGSTSGILAAVRSAVHGRFGSGSIICSKYSHKSVMNAAELCGLSPFIIEPPVDVSSGVVGSVIPESIDTALKANVRAAAVVITSPTYEGVVSDIATIAGIVHDYDIPLIVDAAHGAHFPFSRYFPKNPLRLGADAVVTSLHKTLPALTQTALVMTAADSYIDADILAAQLRIFESSSPSYILLSSIARCISFLETEASAWQDCAFDKYAGVLSDIESRLEGLKRLSRICKSECFFDYDRGKIVISTLGAACTGNGLADTLRMRGFEPEAYSDSHVLAMTSVADDMDTLLQFADSLLEIDAATKPDKKKAGIILSPGI